ncbi:MAG: S9 family peptidase [Bacteroidota bacterium]
MMFSYRILLLSAFLIGVTHQILGQNSAEVGKITLEDIWLRYKYIPGAPSSFSWMNDDRFYTTLEPNPENDAPIIWKNSIEDEKKIDQILNLAKVEFSNPKIANQIRGYEFNDNEQKVLLKGAGTPIYRYSSREPTYVYDVKSQEVIGLHDQQAVSNATFSPNSKKVAYTFENNVYFHDLVNDKMIQVTKDGETNKIINGSTDWVYEEELAFVKAFAWSPDNRRLAFFRFDESEVPQFDMTMYGSLYPQDYQFKYPKAGEKNSVVTIHIFDLTTQKTLKVDIGTETDQYIARMTWTPDNKLALLRLNRLQNQLDLLIADPESGSSTVILSEKSDTYIDVSDDTWFFLKESSDFLWLSDRDGYRHIYRYGRDGEMKKQLTQGTFEVSSTSGDALVAVDEANNTLYYMSTEVSPMERHLYSLNLNGKGKKRLTEEPGIHQITFSSGFQFFVDSYSTLKSPGKTVLKNKKGEVIKALEVNDRLNGRLGQLNMSDPEFFSFKTRDSVALNAYMIKPSNFDEKREYPVLMFVYGGPGSQQVLNRWGSFNYMWFQMLAQNGYIVTVVDNRGTGGQGSEFQKVTYADLGKYETIDQVEAARYLQKLPFVDATRIGIWGWSYGGYLTSLCMTKGNGIFKAGMAVAPVTNWRFYDTIYTERYLKTPQENAKGYDDNSPINFAADLQGHYLLIHGTADDNVHFQNTVEWVDALVNANKQFDLFFYPNKNHGIYGGYTRFHLYKKMTDFLYENL